jgi:hypothetical protein
MKIKKEHKKIMTDILDKLTEKVRRDAIGWNKIAYYYEPATKKIRSFYIDDDEPVRDTTNLIFIALLDTKPSKLWASEYKIDWEREKQKEWYKYFEDEVKRYLTEAIKQEEEFEKAKK